ncbi:hypothetical protein G6F70_005000 [Rhizopus microsporus]|nr:hypothetical protein G6F71_005987 [Rhizopus microsporus]KAG1199352.1 hypothetical protein G6F70_005000 [Rhizopus microsporus]KAG1209796.1 hypothetical protein G6F69_006043 [Rhizopus microsporus]KAG1233044.1 hypothetical protein G6F67_004557 [Rhizopus microsporus]KAG1265925.1 hypothetical protein G6F68_003180 [Rhizopus microsporus]
MKNNLEAHPVQHALILALEQNGITKQTFDFEKPPSEAIKVALETFKVNFKNMWTDKKIINKLLDKANYVLKHAGYSKFTMELHPSTSFSSLNALHLNALTLYQLLTQELTKVDQDQSSDQEGKPESKLVAYGYDQQPIASLEFARQSKDAVLNAIFNMDLLQTSCKSHDLDFAHRVICLPGLKTVRILDTQKRWLIFLTSRRKRPMRADRLIIARRAATGLYEKCQQFLESGGSEEQFFHIMEGI